MTSRESIGSVVDFVIGAGRDMAKLTESTTDDTVVAVAAGLRALVGVVEAGVQGSLTVEECKAAIAGILDRKALNAAGADAIVAARRAAAAEEPES